MQELLDAIRGRDRRGMLPHWEALRGLQEVNQAQELWETVLTNLAGQDLPLNRAKVIAQAARDCVPAQAALWLAQMLSKNMIVAKRALDH